MVQTRSKVASQPQQPADNHLNLPNSTATAAPPHERPFRFLELPAEVRLLIYQFALPDDVSIFMEAPEGNKLPTIKATERLLDESTPRSALTAYSKTYRGSPENFYFSGASDGDVVTGIFGLLRTCRTVHGELVPLLGPLLDTSVPSLSVAGWLGTCMADSLGPFLLGLDITRPPKESEAEQRRWMRIVLARLPSLRGLSMMVDGTKNVGVNGSRWSVGALKLMKMVKETNSELGKHVVILHDCNCTPREHCSYIAFTNMDQIGPEIDVEHEYRAWLGRRKGGVGDLEINMRDRWRR